VVKKYLGVIVLFVIFKLSLIAGLVDGVSVVVNNNPITLYEIKKYSVNFKVPIKKAVEALIREKLEENLIKKYNLSTDDTEITDEMEKISSRAGMSIVDFENYLEKKGVDIDAYKKDLAKKLTKRKLYKKIVSGKIKRADEKELKEYYQRHINLYSIPQMIQVTEYDSKDKKLLEKLIQNPMLNINGISRKEQVLKSKNLNPKLLYILQQANEGSFTPILTLKDGFVSFYIKRKINVKPISFEKVKNAIFAEIMNKREKDIIKSYFDKLVSEASIKVLREPR
jgi:predicted HTH domain antitoxin